MEAIWNWIVGWVHTSFGVDLLWKSNFTNPQGWINLVFSSITFIFGALLAYRGIYLLMGIFGKSRRYSKKPMDKKYAFVFSARNEEAVIANLIDSVREQSYPQELIDIIVVADNCDDRTAEIAREKGCIVYERHDLTKCRKGYALQFLYEHLKHDLPNGIESYYSYIFMDSDNVMAKDFLEQLNNAFQDGYDICTGYRNVKNADDNWLTALSAINWYRSVIVSLRARSIINSAAQVGGTGYGVRSHILKEGWDYTMITEDGEMTTRLMAKSTTPLVRLSETDYESLKGSNKKLSHVILVGPNGKKIKARVQKWERTEIELIAKYIKKLGCTTTPNAYLDPIVNETIKVVSKVGSLDVNGAIESHYTRLGYVEAAQFFDEQPTTMKITIRQRLRWIKGGMVNWLFNDWRLFWSFIKRPRWSKYDIYWEMFPYGLFTFLLGFIQLVLSIIFWANGYTTEGFGWANIFSYVINLTVMQYLGGLVCGIPVIVKEWNKVHFTVPQAIGYIFLWPFYDMIGVPLSLACLFMHITWKPVPHHVIANGDQLMDVHRQKEAQAKARKEKKNEE